MSQVYQLLAEFIHAIDPAFQHHDHDQDHDYLLSVLSELARRRPKIVSRHFHQLLLIYSQMISHPASFPLENLADTLQVIVDTFCATAKSRVNPDLIAKILRASVLTFTHILEEVTADWSHPIEASGEDSLYSNQHELTISKQVMNSANELGMKVGYDLVRATFAPIFREYLLGQEWRFRYAALLLASQMGEGVESIEEVHCFVEMAISELRSSLPKVRFAALELIGQLGEDCNPLFQQQYFEAIVPLLIKLLGDNLPRIVSHAFACLSNFFAKFSEFWKIEKHSSELLVPLLHYLKNGTPFMQACALETVTGLASVKNCLGQSLGCLIEACGELIQSCSQITNEAEILNQSFEALGLLLSSQQKSLVEKYVPRFIESLIMNREKVSSACFLACWSHICDSYDAFVDLESTDIIDFLMKTVGRQMEQGRQETAISGLDCIVLTFKSFSWRMIPYVEPIYLFAKIIFLSEKNYYLIRNKAVDVMVGVLLNIKTEQGNQESIFYSVAFNLLRLLIEVAEKSILPEGQSLLLVGIIEGISELIQPLGPALDFSIILALSDKLLIFRQKYEDIIGSEEEDTREGEEEVDEDGDGQDENCSGQVELAKIDSIEEQKEELLDLIDLIPEVYGKLLTVSKEADKQTLINILIPQISFSVEKKTEWKMFGLNLLVSLIESCSYSDLSVYWGHLMVILNRFTSDPNNRIRNLGVYGMGLIFEKTPLQLIAQENVRDWLKSLWLSNSTPFENQKDERPYIHFCKDNIVSALGKLLRSFGLAFPNIFDSSIYQKWFFSLPLKHDENQSNIQQEILIDLLSTNPGLIVHDVNDMKKICEIFASFMVLRIQDNSGELLLKTKDCFGKINKWDLFQRSSQQLWNSLSCDQQAAISRLMAYQ